MTVLTTILLGIGLLLSSTQTFAQSEQAPSALLAQSKKKPTKKKPKKKKSDVQLQDEAFGPDDIEAISSNEGDMGSGIHREQEGVDTPYKAEASLRTDLSFLSVKVGDADPYQNTVIDIGIEWLFLLGSMAIGPDISYKSFTTATTIQTNDPATNTTTTEVSEVSNSSWSAGGMFKWNFGNVDKATLIPFAYAGVAYRAAESKAKDADAQKSSGSVIRVGGGMNMFIDSNIAFNPRAEFRMETDKNDDDENAIETSTSGFKLLVGIAVFI